MSARYGVGSRMTSLATGAVALVVAVLSQQGCGGDSTAVNPAPAATTTTQPPMGYDGGTDAPNDAAPDTAAEDAAGQDAIGPAIRTVTTRNPLGVLDPDNLLRDGDFELSAADGMQVGWLYVSPANTRIGSSCRSGLRCIALSRGQFTASAIVWPDAPAVEFSFYAHINSDDCEHEAGGIVTSMGYNGPQWVIGPETPAPVDGWCHFKSTINVPSNPDYQYWVVGLFVMDDASGSAVFDEAYMHAVTPSQRHGLTQAKPISPKVMAMTEKLRKAHRDHSPLDPKPPKPVSNPTGRRGGK